MARKGGYTGKRSKGEKMALVIIALMLVVVCIVMMTKFNQLETKDTVGAFAFEIGALDAEGAEVKNTACIRLKKAVNADGLEIVLAEEADIKYSVYFYSLDDDGEEVFIDVVANLEADFDAESIPEGAELAKVVIQPTADAEVDLFEINGYANQLTITYNK